MDCGGPWPLSSIFVVLRSFMELIVTNHAWIHHFYLLPLLYMYILLLYYSVNKVMLLILYDVLYYYIILMYIIYFSLYQNIQ